MVSTGMQNHEGASVTLWVTTYPRFHALASNFRAFSVHRALKSHKCAVTLGEMAFATSYDIFFICVTANKRDRKKWKLKRERERERERGTERQRRWALSPSPVSWKQYQSEYFSYNVTVRL